MFITSSFLASNFGIAFQSFQYFVWSRITNEGFIPETGVYVPHYYNTLRYNCESLFLYFNNLVSVTLGEPKVHIGTCRQLTQKDLIYSHHPFHSNMFGIILHHISVSLNTLFAILCLQLMRVQNLKRAYDQYCWYNPVLKWYITISWSLFAFMHVFYCTRIRKRIRLVRALSQQFLVNMWITQNWFKFRTLLQIII